MRSIRIALEGLEAEGSQRRRSGLGGFESSMHTLSASPHHHSKSRSDTPLERVGGFTSISSIDSYRGVSPLHLRYSSVMDRGVSPMRTSTSSGSLGYAPRLPRRTMNSPRSTMLRCTAGQSPRRIWSWWQVTPTGRSSCRAEARPTSKLSLRMNAEVRPWSLSASLNSVPSWSGWKSSRGTGSRKERGPSQASPTTSIRGAALTQTGMRPALSSRWGRSGW